MSADKQLIPERDERGQVETFGEAIERAGFRVDTVQAQCATHGAYEAGQIELGNRTIVGFCPRCADEQQQREMDEHRAMLQRQRSEAKQQRILSIQSNAGIPARFRQCTFDGFAIDAGTDHAVAQERAVRVCRAYTQRWDSVREKGTVLVLNGGPGTGKTHLACAIANTLMNEHMATVTFGTVTDYVRNVKAAFQRDSGVSERDAVRSMLEPDLIIMDEMGQRMTEYDQQLVFDVINARYAEMKPMVLMSNLSADELGGVLGERLADRLHEVGTFLPLAWPSYRGR